MRGTALAKKMEFGQFMRIVPHKELSERQDISRNVSPVKALGNGWDVVS
jgi:hypothetical protein